MKCPRCGATGLLKHDLCGSEGCVECYGTKIQKTSANKCSKCKKTCKGTINGMCNECHKKWLDKNVKKK